MQHPERRRAQPAQGRKAIEVADDRNNAVRAKPCAVLDAAGEAVEAYFGMEQAGRAKRHVAAADQ